MAAVILALALTVAAEQASAHNDSSDDGSDDGGASKSQGLGFIGVALAAVGFGSNFVVIKKYDPGDGMFFQFCECVGIFFTGIIYYVAKGAPAVQTTAMAGGVLWATGNIMCPIIIESIGMGLGLSIWGALNMLTGWGSAHFGILGVSKQTVSHTGMNVAGAFVAVASVIVYANVKTQSKDANEQDAINDGEDVDCSGKGAEEGARRRLTSGSAHSKSVSQVSYSGAGVVTKNGDKKSGNFVLGVGLSLIAGVLFGSCFNPAQGVSDHAANHHCNKVHTPGACADVLLDKGKVYCKWDSDGDDGKKCGGQPIPDMAFSQFIGIFFASLFYFTVYGLGKWILWNRNNPTKSVEDSFTNGPNGFMFINAPLIIPAFGCGVIWAIAQIGWFIANDNLSMSIAFPIVCAIPAIIGNAWGLFVFNEVQTNPKNLAVLGSGITLTVIASILTALSK